MGEERVGQAVPVHAQEPLDRSGDDIVLSYRVGARVEDVQVGPVLQYGDVQRARLRFGLGAHRSGMSKAGGKRVAVSEVAGICGIVRVEAGSH